MTSLDKLDIGKKNKESDMTYKTKRRETLEGRSTNYHRKD